MRKIGVSMIIVCLYCFPYVYFSMYQDFANHSMLGYLIMIVATSILAFLGKVYGSSTISFVIGNIASGIISFYFISEMAGNEQWGGYFKPLSPNQLLIFVCCLNLIPQLLIMKLANKYKNTYRP